jgi:hypothetical protein
MLGVVGEILYVVVTYTLFQSQQLAEKTFTSILSSSFE